MQNNKLLQSLENYKYDLQYYNEKTKDLEKLKNELYKMQSIVRDKMTKKIDFSIESLQCEQLKTKYLDEQTKLENIEAKKRYLEDAIENLPQPYKTIFFLRYIKSCSFDEIATKMNYSSKRIYQLHKLAISQFTSQTTSIHHSPPNRNK